MSKKTNNQTVYLVVILIVAFILRVWKLNEVPISLFGDEIDVGLQAKSILQTGKDYFGNDWPIFFRSFAEYRLPIQIYSAVPFIAAFGMNEWGVRLASVVFGVISIFGFYLMTKELINKNIALIATALLTISPWHIQFSRQANDAGFLLPFVFFGLYFLIKGRFSWISFMVSAVLFSISFFAYPIATVFVPLFVLVTLIIYRKDFILYGFKKLFITGLVSMVLLLPFIDKSATHRISYLAAEQEQEVMEELIRNRRWDNSYIARIFYNKNAIITNSFFEQYIEPYSPQFLFLSGDPNPRHSIGDYGMLYHFEIITVLIGIFFLKSSFKNKHKVNNHFLLLAWLILAPLPASIAGDSYHASRLILLLPPVLILSAFGINQIIKFLKTKQGIVFAGIFIFFMILDITKYFHRYYLIWPNESWNYWNFGFEQTINEVGLLEKDYERVYFNNSYEPMLPRFLFWKDYNMKDFQAEFKGDVYKDQYKENFRGFQLTDKYYFGEFIKPIEPIAQPENLIVASALRDVTNPKIFDGRDLKLLKIINSPENLPIFYIFTGEEDI